MSPYYLRYIAILLETAWNFNLHRCTPTYTFLDFQAAIQRGNPLTHATQTKRVGFMLVLHAYALANQVMDTEKPLHESLSDREFQTLTLIASGLTVGEIALRLSLSVKTVSMYRTRLLEKMQLKHNAELTHYAIKNNLVD